MRETVENGRRSHNGTEIQSPLNGRTIAGAAEEDLKTLTPMVAFTKHKERPMPNEPMSNSERRRRDFLLKEHDAQLIASTLQAAADRAQAFYKSDCGGCGEWCDEPPRCNSEEADHCHHIRSLRKAILAPLDKTDKGE